MRVMIIQNALVGGGRILVLASIIRLLNWRGIVPDILTFRSPLSEAGIRYRYGADLKLRIRRLPNLIRGLPELKIPLLNAIARSMSSEYDLLINSNNTLARLPVHKPCLTYMHFPRESRIRTSLKSLAFPERGGYDCKWHPDRAYRSALSRMYGTPQVGQNDSVVANSIFTKQAVLEVYQDCGLRDVQVVYPPVETNVCTAATEKRKNLVVSLGRFVPDKRQLEQTELARRLPELEFHIVGFVGAHASRKYFRECKQAVRTHSLKNVVLHPNAQEETRKVLIRQASYFLHSLRNEPFGIATVQAIAAGAIPLVHDSGGSREVVPFEELRYADVDDAIEKLRQLSRYTPEGLQRKLLTHIQRFDRQVFEDKMGKLLGDVLAC